MRKLIVVLAGCLLATVALVGAGPTGSGAGEAPPPTVEGLDASLRIDQVQTVGTHNSYHVEPGPLLMSTIRAVDPAAADQLEYTHAPIPEQLGEMAVRQLELDVFADASGGLYAEPIFPLDWTPPPELLEPGFKVLHIQEIDFETTCLTFVICLEQVEAWSDANPGHLPVAILVELKDDPLPDDYGFDPDDFGIAPPEEIDGPALDALDAEIRSVFDPADLLTPDDVQGGYPSLREAVLDGAWPTLGDAAGKVMFLLDNEGEERDLYVGGDDSLAGRPMFTSGDPSDPTAAFVKRNDPTGANQAQIADLVDQGFVVRTRADTPTFEARSGDTTMADAALASGAQWVSTDYPVPGIAARFGSTYFTALPGFYPGRCNPVSAPCPDPPPCRSPFPDVADDHPFRDEICWLAESRITGGYPPSREFRPVNAVSRQAMAAFLFRASGEDEPAGCTQEFTDVPEEHPFFEEVCWLADAGITGGYADGGFHPSDTVTRQAMAAFLARMFGPAELPAGGAQQFSDVPPAHPFFDEVAWLADAGITGGYPDGGFHPAATVTRQAMAAFLQRADQLPT